MSRVSLCAVRLCGTVAPTACGMERRLCVTMGVSVLTAGEVGGGVVSVGSEPSVLGGSVMFLDWGRLRSMGHTSLTSWEPG